MLRNGQADVAACLEHDDMATALPVQRPTGVAEDTHDFRPR